MASLQIIDELFDEALFCIKDMIEDKTLLKLIAEMLEEFLDDRLAPSQEGVPDFLAQDAVLVDAGADLLSNMKVDIHVLDKFVQWNVQWPESSSSRIPIAIAHQDHPTVAPSGDGSINC